MLGCPRTDTLVHWYTGTLVHWYTGTHLVGLDGPEQRKAKHDHRSRDPESSKLVFPIMRRITTAVPVRWQVERRVGVDDALVERLGVEWVVVGGE